MKRIVLILLLLSTSAINAQLNSNAKLIKEKLPEEYSLIKLLASEDWEGDHEMMIYTINNQSDSLIKITEFQSASSYDEKIMSKAFTDWSKYINEKKCIDWGMVEYQYKNQLNAKGGY